MTQWFIADDLDHSHVAETVGDAASPWLTVCGLRVDHWTVSWQDVEPPAAVPGCVTCRENRSVEARRRTASQTPAEPRRGDHRLEPVKAALEAHASTIEAMRKLLDLDRLTNEQQVLSIARRFVESGQVIRRRKAKPKKEPAERTNTKIKMPKVARPKKPVMSRIRIVSGGAPGLGKRR